MSKYIKDCSAAILAGGENRRMPVLKSFIEVEGTRIIERNLRLMKSLFQESFIVSNQPELYLYLNTPLLGDVYDSRGPMTGIFTSLLNSGNRWVFVSACDMPFINKNLISYMALKRTNVDAVVPVANNKAEPLFAFYKKNLLPSMEKCLLKGEKSLRDFLNSKRVKYITAAEHKRIDNDIISFVNLNSSEDIHRYLNAADRSRFIKEVKRRDKCSVLEQLS